MRRKKKAGLQFKVGPVGKKENLVGSVECFVFVGKFPNLVDEFQIRIF